MVSVSQSNDTYSQSESREKKQNAVYKNTFKFKKQHIKNKKMENNILCNSNQESIATLISDKVDFKPRLIERDKCSHYILVNGTN